MPILCSGCGVFLLVFSVSVFEGILHIIELMDVNKYCGFTYRNESLRVAYVDEVTVATGAQEKTPTYYSKLVKVDQMDKGKDQVLFIAIYI